ncbi:murein biosynthesis integral membrane protein MurJ [Streptomyces sp. NBC_00257]|uniref:murein biosynthesis integral membrane protein MurJ n=1 Tax=unclassified Streptomyces TaxID=2593676 RepID=UPI00224F37EC|nr:MULTISPECIES: murein biosynthesis integral membrane protein MurJ [unclassified Streptomyces]WTB55462.1 murein biosynthesis integral membrane protein MurJ [Streptomyces sp. NBC_00826]WTH91656.1 murein biosynthesis integral membrane protein MurJ [Streptomyces sp. NBC_00825]WTI00384.1 murein biosynthesis integral membrane protein MurJ [Streptomyces sp. NBC_00822]MCX4865875.1 murein biosynthesis integral membrane protein MurJ [Streptomyces sp. NBC_00906]MCX4897114.1 murein biosynthesis integral
MNAPYDGDRGQGAGGAGSSGGPPVPPGPGQVPPMPDPYLQDAYDRDPYRAQDLSVQDPVTEALYDRAAHPPPPPGTYQQPQPLYQQPPAAQYPPDPRIWAQTPPPEPGGPSRHLPYGDDPATTQFVGVDDLVSQASRDDEQPDAFAHLFRDQEGPAGSAPVPAEPEPAPAPAPPKSGGRAAGILKSSALMAAGTLVSRLTGFVRSLVMTAALGAALLGDSFTIAYTLPTMIYILTVGGGLNSVFVPQLVRSMKDDEDGGEAYANRLLTLVMVALGVIVALAVFAAPWLIHMMSPTIANDVAANSVAVTFARYCLPTIFFMGVHVVMGQILNARGKFGAMMWTPVLNNIVMIFTFGMFIWVYGTSAESQMGVQTIPPEGVRLLGIGTLLGLVVQALAMVPYLREAGFRFRPRFDWKGHGLGKTVKLAKWTVLFVLANQAGVLVVTQLATSAGKLSGKDGTGILGYSNAQLIWGMPQAIITVSVMAALLPRISRAAHDDDPGAVRDDISQGLRNSAVAIVPVAFAFLALGLPMCTLLYASAGTEAARSMGFILMAFGLGLIPYSVQYVVLRGFYAYEDTRTPFYNTVIVAAVNAAASALCYVVLPARWAVVGMAASYGLAYAVGVGIAWRRLRNRLGGDLDGAHVVRTYARLCLAAIPAAVLGGGVGFAVLLGLGEGAFGSLAALICGGAVLLGVFFVAAKRMRIEEINGMVGMVRGRLGR